MREVIKKILILSFILSVVGYFEVSANTSYTKSPIISQVVVDDAGNYNGSTDIQVGSYQTVDCVGSCYRGYVKWVAPIMSSDLEITNVKMFLYRTSNIGVNTDNVYINVSTTTSFDPFTITGLNAPAATSTVIGSMQIDQNTNRWDMFDLGNVNVDNDMYFVVKLSNEENNSTDNYVYYKTDFESDQQYRPYFEITYSIPSMATSTQGIVNGFSYGEIIISIFLFFIFAVLLYKVIYLSIFGIRHK